MILLFPLARYICDIHRLNSMTLLIKTKEQVFFRTKFYLVYETFSNDAFLSSYDGKFKLY